MADFTGFYLDGIHSSTYGILRVSDGERYKEGLSPEFEDREIEPIGGSGSIYMGTQYKKTPFEINIAFEHLTEQQLRDMRKWLGGEKLHSFQFDERPYKIYWVKLESRPELEYICFMEESDSVFKQEERVYKGEGTLNFVAYDPFGYCIDNSSKMTNIGLESIENGINWQILDSYSPFTIIDDNISEWGLTSGLKTAEQLEKYNHFVSVEKPQDFLCSYRSWVYNPGDFDANYELFIDFKNVSTEVLKGKEITVKVREADRVYKKDAIYFRFSTDGLEQGNKILFDTKKHTLKVIRNIGTEEKPKYTSDLRYDLIKSVDWSKIPSGEYAMFVMCDIENLIIDGNEIQIKYNYKYY